MHDVQVWEAEMEESSSKQSERAVAIAFVCVLVGDLVAVGAFSLPDEIYILLMCKGLLLSIGVVAGILREKHELGK